MSQPPKAKQKPIASSIPVQAPRSFDSISSFDTLPDNAFIRKPQLVQSPKLPDRTVLLPFSSPMLWRKVASKTFPGTRKVLTTHHRLVRC